MKIYSYAIASAAIFALVCGALWMLGLAAWITVIVLVAAALICSFFYILSSGCGVSRGDADDARRSGWAAVALFAASIIAVVVLLL